MTVFIIANYKKRYINQIILFIFGRISGKNNILSV